MTDLRPLILAELDRREWNRVRLASEAGVSYRLVHDYLSGKDVRGDKLLAILAALGFEVVAPKRRVKQPPRD